MLVLQNVISDPAFSSLMEHYVFLEKHSPCEE